MFNSYLITIKNSEIINMNGKILLIILGKENKVYRKYTLRLWPSSEIKSKKLTACTTRIIRALRNESIPINVGKYNKSNYDKLCINIERLDSFVENYNCLIEKYFSNLESNIEKFNYKSDNLFNCFLKHVTWILLIKRI